MRHPCLRPLLVALALATGSTAMSASAQTAAASAGYAIPSDGTLLSVSASADASRKPDVATLSAGVVTQAANGSAAMQANATQMAKVLAALKKAGIEARDVQTGGITLNPQYKYVDNEAPTITGYQASNSVNVKVRDIAKLGDVIDALVEQGANQVNGPSFGIDKPEPVYDEARLAALAQAQARAATYAKQLGLKVRRIVSISEGGSGGLPRPMPMMAMARMDKASTPVAEGETTLSVSLEVVFELGR